jgi:hypothetical protein
MLAKGNGTMNRCRRLVAAIVCFGFPVIAHAQAPPPLAEFGTLDYPARGNIQLDEGTLDLWVISNFDTDFKPQKDLAWQATLFNLVFPEEGWHYPLYFIPWANGFALVGYGVPQQRYVWLGPPHWKPGEPHHVVMTWSGRKRSMFIDGICEWKGSKGMNISKDVEVEGELHGELTAAILRIGGGNSSITIDEIQIRRIALTTEEIIKSKDAPLVADANTLLLDHCDGGPPEIIGGQTGETAGKLTGKHEIVNGKFGKAIKLWVEKK